MAGGEFRVVALGVQHVVTGIQYWAYGRPHVPLINIHVSISCGETKLLCMIMLKY